MLDRHPKKQQRTRTSTATEVAGCAFPYGSPRRGGRAAGMLAGLPGSLSRLSPHVGSMPRRPAGRDAEELLRASAS